MSGMLTRTCFLLAARLLLVGVLVLPLSGVTQADSSGTSFSGQATVVRATAPLIQPVVLSDTGPLPATGGSQEASLLNVTVPGPPVSLSAEVLHAATIGQGDRSRSEASVANLTLNAAGHTVAADLLMSRAMAVCGSGGASASGSSDIAGLVVDNQTIVVSGQPNQTVTLQDVTVVINEQQSARQGDITVNALDVTVSTPAGNINIVVSAAHADITCPPPGQVSCAGSDFITGGGWIATSSGAKANFAVAGGIKQGAFWGHLEYTDHGTGTKVKGTGVTAYTSTGATSRHIEGTAEINGASGFTYKVDVADNGEPGRATDTFAINLSNGYTASGTLGGGNIQLHKPCT